MAVPLSVTPRRPRSVTASAVKITPKTTSTYRQRKGQAWQQKAFLYCKLIPELNYASRFYAKMLTRLRIYPAYRNASDETEPITEGLPVDLIDRIQDPGGGRSALLSSYGRLMFIVGEGYLFGRDLDKPTERWAFVNTEEISFDGKAILWRPVAGGEAIRFSPQQAEAYRLWTPDPERSGEAESPMRAIIEIAQELDILTKAVSATAVSRMVNGILKVPAELSFGADEAGVDEDAEANPFLSDIIEHIIGVVENAGSPEASAPFLAEGALEYLAGLEWMRTHDPATDYLERDLRKEAIDRAGMGMDLPPEVLKGMAEANHWGARQIKHDTWLSHGSVVAEQFCDDVADAYLRPALREANFARWREVVIAYDDSNVVVPPDRTDDADKAHDRGEVSDPGYRQMKGIAEAMAPSEEEKRINLAIKLRDVRLLKGTTLRGRGARAGRDSRHARSRSVDRRSRGGRGRTAGAGASWDVSPGVPRLDHHRRSQRRLPARAHSLPRGRRSEDPSGDPQPFPRSGRAGVDRRSPELERRQHSRSGEDPQLRPSRAARAREGRYRWLLLAAAGVGLRRSAGESARGDAARVRGQDVVRAEDADPVRRFPRASRAPA